MTGAIFPTILAATGDPHCLDAPVITAARLARLQDAHLFIAHALSGVNRVDQKAAPSSIPAKPNNRGADGLSLTAQSLLKVYADQFPELTADQFMITSGVAWEAIFRASLHLKSDLIVVGPHLHAPGIQNMHATTGFLGSTADGVIRQARCPVMIANAAFPEEMLGFKSIVVGVDFSPSCVVAICLAALLAHRYGSFVATFHMLPIAPYPKYTPQALQAERLRLQKRMQPVDRLLLDGIDHRFILKAGARPHDELLRFVRQTHADLIILGSHTKEKTGKWYSGSVVQRIASQAVCPVIVVNGLEALSPWKDLPFVSRRCTPQARAKTI